jgi:O-antigen/teichoic acid export membrane protein
MWAVPFGAGLGLFADDLVELLGRERWGPAIPLLQAFGWTAAIGHLGFNWTAYFRARGDTVPMAVAGVAAAISFLAVAVPLVDSEGVQAVAWGVAANAVVQLVLRAYFLSRLFDGFDMLRHAVRALSPAVPAIGAVLAVRALESGERGTATALGELALYLAVTLAATAAIERSLLREALGLLRTRPSSIPQP